MDKFPRASSARISQSHCGSAPAVKYQTCGLDKTVGNKERVNWSEPFGGGKLKADGSLVLSQARPCSVVPGPVAKSVMTPGLGGVPRLRRSRLGEYSFCTARAVALGLTSLRRRCAMARKRKSIQGLPVIEPNAAGADVGATQIFVAVPADRDPEPVRCFDTFTADLEALVGWLETCGIRTVVMESTAVYWIPLFQILEKRGIEARLVNARHVKNVPGRKSDVADCQWLQYLHAVGLLRGSFRPDQEICALRSLWRHRDSLIQMASVHLQHMQKALDQMNLQIHHVISDIAGTTGLAILDAILAGERDPKRLAYLPDWRIRATDETIMKSLVGDYRDEHRFTLRQALVAYPHYTRLIGAA